MLGNSLMRLLGLLVCLAACGNISRSDDSDGGLADDASVDAPIDAPAIATLALSMQPSFDFGAVVVDSSSSPSVFTVTNVGGTTSGVVAGAALTGANNSAFTLMTDDCVGATLPPGGTCTVSVTFNPRTVGAKSAALEVTASPGGTATLVLAGTSVGPAELQLTPALLAFGDVRVGSTSEVTATLTNNGGVTTGTLSVMPAGTNATEYSITGGTCMSTATLMPSQSCTVTVRFAPTSRGAKGAMLAAAASPGGTVTSSMSAVGTEVYTLTVSKGNSSGNGSVVASAGINCDASNTDCTEEYVVGVTPPTVSLTATPSTGARFAGFTGGGCTSSPCTVTMDASKTVTASFIAQHNLSVGVNRPNGALGVVTSSSSPTQATQINCTSACTTTTVAFDEGMMVTLTPTAGAGGSVFAGWSGACSGTGPCVVSMTTARIVTATFHPPIAAAATWVLNGSIDSGTPLAVTTVATFVTGSSLSKSAALTGLSFSNAFVADNWPSGTAVDTTKYFEFGVTLQSGHSIVPETVRFNLYNNQTGTSSWQIRSSVDNYGTVLDSGTVTINSASGPQINANVSALGQRAGTTTFRVYTFNNTGNTSPLQRGFRGSAVTGGVDLTVFGRVL